MNSFLLSLLLVVSVATPGLAQQPAALWKRMQANTGSHHTASMGQKGFFSIEGYSELGDLNGCSITVKTTLILNRPGFHNSTIVEVESASLADLDPANVKVTNSPGYPNGWLVETTTLAGRSVRSRQQITDSDGHTKKAAEKNGHTVGFMVSDEKTARAIAQDFTTLISLCQTASGS